MPAKLKNDRRRREQVHEGLVEADLDELAGPVAPPGGEGEQHGEGGVRCRRRSGRTACRA